jgi:hypothetical protein
MAIEEVMEQMNALSNFPFMVLSSFWELIVANRPQGDIVAVSVQAAI